MKRQNCNSGVIDGLATLYLTIKPIKTQMEKMMKDSKNYWERLVTIGVVDNSSFEEETSRNGGNYGYTTNVAIFYNKEDGKVLGIKYHDTTPSFNFCQLSNDYVADTQWLVANNANFGVMVSAEAFTELDQIPLEEFEGACAISEQDETFPEELHLREFKGSTDKDGFKVPYVVVREGTYVSFDAANQRQIETAPKALCIDHIVHPDYPIGEGYPIQEHLCIGVIGAEQPEEVDPFCFVTSTPEGRIRFLLAK